MIRSALLASFGAIWEKQEKERIVQLQNGIGVFGNVNPYMEKDLFNPEDLQYNNVINVYLDELHSTGGAGKLESFLGNKRLNYMRTCEKQLYNHCPRMSTRRVCVLCSSSLEKILIKWVKENDPTNVQEPVVDKLEEKSFQTRSKCGVCRFSLCNVPRLQFGGKTCHEQFHSEFDETRLLRGASARLSSIKLNFHALKIVYDSLMSTSVGDDEDEGQEVGEEEEDSNPIRSARKKKNSLLSRRRSSDLGNQFVVKLLEQSSG